MEGNKDDAIKCFKIAQRAMSAGYHEKAIRFLNKSIKLYPTESAMDLLTELNTGSKSQKPKKHASAATNGTSGNYGTFSKSNGKTDSKPEIVEEYSAEQLDAVKRVKKSSDYYEVLGVDKECGESELKKAYRKLALQLHPDKNKAPGSTDAFKAVGKAFGVLSDTEKREQYNMYGESGQPTNRPQYRYSNMYDDGDIDPDEIFRMFFNGGFPGDNVRVYRRGNSYFYSNRSNHNNNQQRHGNQNVAAWIQFMPLLILLLITMFSNLLVSDPPYSLVRRGDYVYQRDTPKFQVKYFVKSNFDQEYKGSDLRRLQSRVEDEYVEYLRGSCYQERVNKEHMRRRAVYLSSKDLLDRSIEMKTPSCHELEQLFNRA